MAGKFVYLPNGERVWSDDGASTPGSGAASPAGGGIQMGGGKGVSLGGVSGYGYALPMDGYMPNYGDNTEAARLLWLQANEPNAINAAKAGGVTIDRSATDPVRARQYEMLKALEAHAAGGGPSVANALTKSNLDATTQAAMASRGGVRGALAGASPAYGQAAIGGATMRANEQQNAWQALAGAAHGVRGADIAGNVEQAKLNQQIGLANAGFGTQASVANMNASLAGLGNKIGAAGAYGDLVNANTDARLQRRAYNVQGEQFNKKARQMSTDRTNQQYAQTIDTAGKMFAMASDEREKTDIEASDSKLSKMFDALSPYEYRYKDTSKEGTSPGKHISVMAQDLEASELGRGSVFDSKQGHKMVDYGKLAPVMLAELARANKRLNELERR